MIDMQRVSEVKLTLSHEDANILKARILPAFIGKYTIDMASDAKGFGLPIYVIRKWKAGEQISIAADDIFNIGKMLGEINSTIYNE